MLEGLTSLIDSRKIESCPSPNMVQVVREIVHLIKNNPTSVLASDLSDYPQPRKVLRTNATLNSCVMGIEISGLLNEEDIQIAIFEANLAPGTPKSKSFSYRVNILGGDVAEKYKGSTGYSFAEEVFEKVEKDGSPLIVSDNWSETNLSPEDVLKLLHSIQYLSMPHYDPHELTNFGTPRRVPLA